ncbi:50S ribosomal protein L10 [bacterium]|nr:50S ribosomal protein L10 [bacterium]
MKTRAQKEKAVSDLQDKFSRANAAFITHYRGMTVDMLYDLRKGIKAGEGEIAVVKNRLAKIAAKGTFVEGIADEFSGPVALVLSYKDPVPVAKAIMESIKDTSPFAVQTASLEGKTMTADDIKALSTLPDKQTLLSMLCSALQGPSRGFVQVLAAMPRGLVNVLVAVKDQKA